MQCRKNITHTRLDVSNGFFSDVSRRYKWFLAMFPTGRATPEMISAGDLTLEVAIGRQG